MKLLACLLLATLIAAWDLVRLGVLLRKIGNMIIVYQSVRIVLHFDNVTYVRDNLKVISHGLERVADKLQENYIDNIRIHRKISVIAKKMDILESNFLQKIGKRAIAIMTAFGALAGLGTANLGLHADLRNDVNTLQHKLKKLDTLQDTTNDIQESLTDIVNEL